MGGGFRQRIEGVYGSGVNPYSQVNNTQNFMLYIIGTVGRFAAYGTGAGLTNIPSTNYTSAFRYLLRGVYHAT